MLSIKQLQDEGLDSLWPTMLCIAADTLAKT